MSDQYSVGNSVPLSEYPFQHPSPGVMSAFNLCRAAEARITNQLESSSAENVKQTLKKDLYHIRLAGYLLVFGLTDTQVATVQRSIVSAESIVALGAFYDQHFVRTFRRYKGHTPQPSNHPSRPSFDFGVDQLMDEGTLLPYPKNHADARKYAFRRDNYRCMITDKIEGKYLESLPVSEQRAYAGSPETCTLECCHIFSESTNRNLDNENKHIYAGNAWNLLATFGHSSVLGELNGNKIHSLPNILTLEPYMHDRFDDLSLWFEATETPHRYKIATTPSAHWNIHGIRNTPTFVQFRTPDAHRYPLPSPIYLRIHAACCKVAHMAGAAGYLELLEDDDTYDPYGPVPAGALMARLVDMSSDFDFMRVVEPL